MSTNIFSKGIRNLLDGLDNLISDSFWTPDERSRVAFNLLNNPLENINNIFDDALVNPIRRKIRARKNLENMYYSLDLKNRGDYNINRISSNNGRSVVLSVPFSDSKFEKVSEGKLSFNILKIINKDNKYIVDEKVRLSLPRNESDRIELGDSICECVATYIDEISPLEDNKDFTVKPEVTYTVLRATGKFSGVRAILIKYGVDNLGRRNRIIEFLYE
jgi:hypothetical protein